MLLLAMAPAHAYSREYQMAKYKDWSNGPYWCATNDGTPRVGDPSAYGCIEMNGDYLQIADGKKDGKRAGMQWKTGYGRHGLCVNKFGKDFYQKGYYKFPSGKRVCNKNFREGSWITFRVGTCNGSKFDCSKTKNWRNWGDWVKRKNEN